MTDKSKKIWKGVGITALILGGIYILVSLFRGWNPLKWFSGEKTEPNGNQNSYNDCIRKLNADGMSDKELNIYVTKEYGFDSDYLEKNKDKYPREELIRLANSSACDKYKRL